MKKVAITGHTKGIGKCLYDVFLENDFKVVGFSRSTGHDISILNHRKLIIDQLSDVDIFINNAYFPQAQLELLKEVSTLWSGKDRVIVNLNSKTRLISDPPDFLKEYATDKQQQHDYAISQHQRGLPQIISVTTGLVDTDMSKVFDSKKVDPVDLAEFIFQIIKFRNLIAVQDILLDVPKLDWNDIKKS
jgi:short-subunit dehydrogenase involved in D-alanine esterification of teichoic acids